MSKIGKKPIQVPEGVTIEIKDTTITVTGPKGSLSYDYDAAIEIHHNENELSFALNNEEKKNIWGLTRTLVDNMIQGVVSGYEKKLLVI